MIRAAPLALLLLSLPTMRFGVDGRRNVHARVTDDGLDFLRPALRAAITGANRGEDKDAAYDIPERHFTNCLFRESVTYINHRYGRTLDALSRQDSRVAVDQFGKLLHGAQDFYAHSAWVDPAPIGLGFGGPRGPLIEPGTDLWSLPDAYGRLRDDIVVIQGDPLAGVTIDLPRDTAGKPASAVPVVTILGRRHRGLMTSTAAPISFATAQCPPVGSDCWSDESVCIRHAEPRKEPAGEDEIARCLKESPEIYENCFHHDDPKRPRHDQAVAAAVRQTAHEWCRLLHLTSRSERSGDAVGLLLTLWVQPPEKLKGSATPHPVETPCASERGTDAVNVQLSPLPHDTLEHYVAAVYTSDLRRSTRVQFERGKIPERALTLCVTPGDSVIVSVWGWNGDDDFGPESSAVPVRGAGRSLTRSSRC